MEHPRNHIMAVADQLVAVACVLGSKLAAHELVGAGSNKEVLRSGSLLVKRKPL